MPAGDGVTYREFALQQGAAKDDPLDAGALERLDIRDAANATGSLKSHARIAGAEITIELDVGASQGAVTADVSAEHVLETGGEEAFDQRFDGHPAVLLPARHRDMAIALLIDIDVQRQHDLLGAIFLHPARHQIRGFDRG